MENMKKVFLFIMMTCCFCVAKSQYYEWDFFNVNDEGDTLYYVIKSDATVYLADKDFIRAYDLPHTSSYWGKINNGHITIPASVLHNDTIYEVTGIALSTFFWCDDLKSVTIPNSIKYIEGLAFCYTGIDSLTIPENVIYMGAGVFSHCSNLKTLNYNAVQCSFRFIHSAAGGITYAPVFWDCKFLSEINIGSSVQTIPTHFITNIALQAITIPNSVKVISKEAFIDCPNLVHVSLGSGLDTIGQNAFYYNPLGSIICNATNPSIMENGGFNTGTLQDARVVIPCNTKAAYQNAAGWSEFAHFIDPCADLAEVETTEFSLYPNPATTELNIACSTNIETIEVFNILGQRVYAAQVKSTFAKVNTTNFVTGNYIAKLYTDNGITTKKFIVK